MIKVRQVVAALVMIAMGAVAASSASAAEFHSSTTFTAITGAQGTQVTFTFNSGQFKCTTATFSGTTSAKTVSEVLLTPTFAGCKAFGLNAPVDLNGCGFRLTNTGATSVGLDIVCPGKPMEITVTFCGITIPGQTEIGSIFVQNIAGGDIETTMNLEGFQYAEDGEACATQGEHSNGRMTGTAKVNGDDTTSNISYS